MLCMGSASPFFAAPPSAFNVANYSLCPAFDGDTFDAHRLLSLRAIPFQRIHLRRECPAIVTPYRNISVSDFCAGGVATLATFATIGAGVAEGIAASATIATWARDVPQSRSAPCHRGARWPASACRLRWAVHTSGSGVEMPSR